MVGEVDLSRDARQRPGGRANLGRKSGNVARSLPSSAVSLVKRSPVSCMPSPESPADRTITRSSRSTCFARSESSPRYRGWRAAFPSSGGPPGGATSDGVTRLSCVQDDVRDRCLPRETTCEALRRLGEQCADVERSRHHRELALRRRGPLFARAVAVELHAVAVRVTQIERLADAVVRRSVE